LGFAASNTLIGEGGLQWLPEICPVLLRNLYRVRKHFVVPGLHRSSKVEHLDDVALALVEASEGLRETPWSEPLLSPVLLESISKRVKGN
jgi:hypothetical protein